jgi:hypothetical protein
MEAISEKILRHFEYLGTEGEKIEQKIKRILELEYRRRLVRYEHINRILARKYGMSFEEFEKREMVKQKGYTWDVESDSDEWEMALDGIHSMKQRLAELLGEQTDA